MTFILAIQLNDSTIIASDHRKAELKDDDTIHISAERIGKMYLWKNGAITGTGEATVIDRAVEFFIKIAKSDLEKMPACLKISRLIRELELDRDINQVRTAHLLCASKTETGAQLYCIKANDDDDQNYSIQPIRPKTIIINFFDPDFSAIQQNILDLYANLKDRSEFSKLDDWIHHYLLDIANIFYKQSLYDPMMSPTFNIFFQSKAEFFCGNVEDDFTFTYVAMPI